MKLQGIFNSQDIAGYAREHPQLFAYVKKAMAQPGKQFLLIGDTNHSIPELREFLHSPALPALFSHAGIPHAAVEFPRELAAPEKLQGYRDYLDAFESTKAAALAGNDEQSDYLRRTYADIAQHNFWREFGMDVRKWTDNYEIGEYSTDMRAMDKIGAHFSAALQSGALTEEQLGEKIDKITDAYADHKKKKWNGLLLNGTALTGLRVTAADSLQWWKPSVPTDSERAFLGDREVADYIRRQTHGEKTAVIYGGFHFRHKGTMGDRLGRDGESVYIDIYQNRAQYERDRREMTWAGIMPDKVYLLDERTLEDADPALYRSLDDPSEDPGQSEQPEIARRYGEAANPAEKAEALARFKQMPHIDPAYFNYVP